MRRLLVLTLGTVVAVSGAAAAQRSRAPTVSLAAVGDVAMLASSDEGAGFFTRVRPALVGDVVLGNLEGTLANSGVSKCGAGSTNCFAFRAPPSYARVLERAGFTVLNLANNHALDYGPEGQA